LICFYFITFSPYCIDAAVFIIFITFSSSIFINIFILLSDIDYVSLYLDITPRCFFITPAISPPLLMAYSAYGRFSYIFIAFTLLAFSDDYADITDCRFHYFISDINISFDIWFDYATPMLRFRLYHLFISSLISFHFFWCLDYTLLILIS